MVCPKCGGKLKTMDTMHDANNSTLRRKKCMSCNNIIHTAEYEVVMNDRYRDKFYEANMRKRGIVK